MLMNLMGAHAVWDGPVVANIVHGEDCIQLGVGRAWRVTGLRDVG